jgi:hypothetical protein
MRMRANDRFTIAVNGYMQRYLAVSDCNNFKINDFRHRGLIIQWTIHHQFNITGAYTVV